MATADAGLVAKWRVWLVPALTAAALIATPVSAQASLVFWSTPITLDQNNGPSINAVSCYSTGPSTFGCAAVDDYGRVTVFNPASPGSPPPVQIDASNQLTAISCVSHSQCTAVDANGNAVTFSPDSPGSAAPSPVDSGNTLDGISCPAQHQCTAVDGNGHEVTFDPTAITAQNPTVIDGHQVLDGVSCPTTSRCVAVDQNGSEIIFNPQPPTFPVAHQIDGSATLTAVACPSANLCSAVDQSGFEVSFNPSSPGSPSAVKVDNQSPPNALACFSTSICTEVDNNGYRSSFNPSSPGSPTPVQIDGSATMRGVVCMAANMCVAVDANGQEVSFDANGSSQQPHLVDAGNFLDAVSCLLLNSSDTQCTAVDGVGQETNFQTTQNGGSTPHMIDSGNGGLNGISCITVTECDAVDSNGNEVNFNPQSPGSPTPHLVDTNVVSSQLNGVSCYTVSGPAVRCTAVDAGGDAVTYDPTASGGFPAPVRIDSGNNLAGVSCPSSSVCVAVDNAGNAITFTPGQSPNATVQNIDPHSFLSSVACPSTIQCTAVDGNGNEITFTPGSTPSPHMKLIDPGNQLFGVSCVSSTLCVAVDYAGGTVQGDPTGSSAWTVQNISGAEGVDAVSCQTTVSNCLAVDRVGIGFVATPSNGSPVPVDTTPPTILGNASVGQTLNEQHGTWTHNPTGYQYQWEDCDAGGGNCVPISGATGPSYTITASDQNHTIVVQETAFNQGGFALGPAASASTGVVNLGVPVDQSVPTITGTAVQGNTLTEHNGSWSPAPTGFAYQWYRCDASGQNCAAIPSATGQSYQLTAADIGSTISVLETASNTVGAGTAAASVPTAVVQMAPPAEQNPPTVSGSTVVGQTLNEANGTWTSAGPVTYGYQWEDCNSGGSGCAAIANATSQSYTLTANDAGHTIVVLETATNAGGQNSSASTPTAVVTTTGGGGAPTDTSPPTISGTPAVGQPLAASPGNWTGATPIAVGYQWQRCAAASCSDITGANQSTYTLTPGDQGAYVQVVVTATNSAGHGQANSAQVGPVAPGSGGSCEGQKPALQAALAVSGPNASTKTILKNGGFATSFAAPCAGQLAIQWTLKKHRHVIVIASASMSVHAAGQAPVTIALTSLGRRLLRRHHSVTLTATGSFTVAKADSSVSTTITLSAGSPGAHPDGRHIKRHRKRHA